MEKYPVTHKGYDLMNAELKQLKSVDRPAIIQAIAEARAHGDLSENAEYSAAKEKQSFIEGRINELEARISRADVIDIKLLSNDTVKFGATVKLVDEDDGNITYQIVGELEADIKQNKISITAPIARALINKKVGDTVEVKTPKGGKEYEVMAIDYV